MSIFGGFTDVASVGIPGLSQMVQNFPCFPRAQGSILEFFIDHPSDPQGLTRSTTKTMELLAGWIRNVFTSRLLSLMMVCKLIYISANNSGQWKSSEISMCLLMVWTTTHLLLSSWQMWILFSYAPISLVCVCARHCALATQCSDLSWQFSHWSLANEGPKRFLHHLQFAPNHTCYTVTPLILG